MIAALKLWLYGIGAALLAAAVFFIRKLGADAERMRQAKADMKAASTVATARAEAKAASDEALNRETDRWTRN